MCLPNRMCSKGLCGHGWLSCVWVWHVMFRELHSTVCLKVIGNKSIVSPTSTSRNAQRFFTQFLFLFVRKHCLEDMKMWLWLWVLLFCTQQSVLQWCPKQGLNVWQKHQICHKPFFSYSSSGVANTFKNFCTANIASWRKMRTTRHDGKHTDSNCFKEQSWIV